MSFDREGQELGTSPRDTLSFMHGPQKELREATLFYKSVKVNKTDPCFFHISFFLVNFCSFFLKKKVLRSDRFLKKKEQKLRILESY